MHRGLSSFLNELEARIEEANRLIHAVIPHLDVEHQPQPEHAGKDDSKHRVFLHAAVFFQKTDAECANHVGDEGADGKGYADAKHLRLRTPSKHVPFIC